MPYTARDLITEALIEMGAYAEGQAVGPADAAVGLNKFNRILDEWNADNVLIYDTPFTTFTLVPNLSPHTIGPNAATFAQTQRPIKIISASLVLNNVTPNVNNPMYIRDADWWANQRIQSLATTFPTDLYYEPSIPNGQLWIWPVPTINYKIQLQMQTILNQVLIGDTLTLAPAYKQALIYTLAEELCPSFGKTLSATLAGLATRSRARVMDANTAFPPRISTFDTGMKSPSNQEASFNYRTGRDISE